MNAKKDQSTLHSYLLRLGRGRLLAIAVLGLIAAVGATLQVAVVSRLLQPEGPHLGLFAAIAIGTFAALAGTRIVSQRLVSEGAMQIRLDICRRIMASDLRTAERAGSAHLLSVITEDVSSLGVALASLPAVATDCLIVLGAMTYLAVLSFELVLVLLAALVLGTLLTGLLFRRGMAWTRRATRERHAMVERYRLIVDGTKELKLDQARRRWNSFEVLPRGALRVRDANRVAEAYHATAGGLSQLVAFAAVASTSVVGREVLGVPSDVLATFALSTLFLLGPMESIINRLPTIASSQAALARIENLGLELAGAAGEQQHPSHADSFESIELEEVVFAHRDADRVFRLGPIDFSLRRGQIVFVVGPNGCGKSTFGKVLSGLYPPDEGRIVVDGTPVTAANRDAVRQLFGGVFVDFCLFPEVLGEQRQFDQAKADALLAKLGLANKVAIENGRFSTTALSTGQKKRLALVALCMRDPAIYLFDEWAADQDPSFKKIFYRQILPELRDRGRTVVAITHDEAYFDAADAIVKLEDGHIVAEPTRMFMARLTGNEPVGQPPSSRIRS